MNTTALSRFLRYVTVDTRSDEHSATIPSTPGQLVAAPAARGELTDDRPRGRGTREYGYVMATIPATRSRSRGAGRSASSRTWTRRPKCPAQDVRPIVHRAIRRRDLVLPDDPSVVLRAADDPALAAQMGNDIVTASGLTLLGADDKAGVAEIVAAASTGPHPDIPHGLIRIAFTPDEEIGRGADHFDVARFGAVCAYTLDGGGLGELEYESFSADAITVTFKGFNTHPGYAKGRMVNAIRVAADFIAPLPRTEMSPETTEGYEGYLHPYQMHAGVDRTTVKVLVRDFVTAGSEDKEALVEQLAREASARHPGSAFEIRDRRVVPQHARSARSAPAGGRAMRATPCGRSGLEPIERPIRGGTDGSRLSFMGLPTPNLFAGEHNFHSRLEWVRRRTWTRPSR